MTKSDVARLLTLIAAFDRRTIGEADVEAWHLILAELDPEDCADAIRQHFATSHAWLMPVDIRTIAQATARRRAGLIRQERLDAQIAEENPPLELVDRERPLLALMAGTPVRPVPRPDWQHRHGKPAVEPRAPFTAEELAAAKQLLADAARESADA